MRRICCAALTFTMRILHQCAKSCRRFGTKWPEQVEITLKYEGYLQRQMRQVEEFRRTENVKIPENIDYENITGLRIEARQKLSALRPETLGAAQRISGVSPGDIAVLMIKMEQMRRGAKA